MNNKKEWIVLSVLSLAASAAPLLVAVIIGACSAGIETAMGTTVPMKCHWTVQAVIIISILPVIVSILQLIMADKRGRRYLALVLFISAALIFLITTNAGIGICSTAGMTCGTMALGVRIAMVILAVLSIVQLVRAPGAKDKPKRRF